MRRILAEVIEADQSPPDVNGLNDLPFRKVRCLVKVLSGVPEGHHLPADVKDATCVIERDALFPWEYGPGTKVILNPRESVELIGKTVSIPDMPSLRGRVVSYKTDINGDGFTERIVENSFVRVVIGPRFGARIWELHHKRRGVNVLHQTYDYNNDFYEYGGQEDHIAPEEGRGELWNAEFTEKKVCIDDTGCRLTYQFKSEKSKGLTVEKVITIPVDQPVVSFTVTFKYSGAEQAPADGKPDEFEMSHWSRSGIAMDPGPIDSNTVFLPTKGKVKEMQSGMGWSDQRCWSMSAPYALSRNMTTGIGTALILNKDQLKSFKVWWSREFHTLEPYMHIVKIPKDSEQSYTHALVVCDSVCAEPDGMALVTVGPISEGETPVFVMTTSASTGNVELLSDGKKMLVDTEECAYGDAAVVCQGTSWFKQNPQRHCFSEIKANGRQWMLSSGGKR